jgi:hypothetical protein
MKTFDIPTPAKFLTEPPLILTTQTPPLDITLLQKQQKRPGHLSAIKFKVSSQRRLVDATPSPPIKHIG